MPRKNKTLIACLTAMGGVVCLLVVLFGIFLFTSCSFNKPLVASGLPDPDRAFQTGTVAGYNIYVWECYQGKHIVVFNVTAEMTSGAYQRQEVACGEMTEIEKAVAKERIRELDPKRFWH